MALTEEIVTGLFFYGEIAIKALFASPSFPFMMEL